ncbi:MAG: ATP-dependent helicase, partial [Alphaproteobacteria bacterium]|nr:ATP-dependent helicase [Alphaproteobacteria bacterium]
MCDRASPTPLSFEGAVKLWSLRAPRLGYDVIMVDEAQDTNGPALSVIEAQSAQTIYVGDPHQQIYEWRGAIDALAKVSISEERALTQTFRFGPKISAVANQLLATLGERRRIVPNPERDDRVGPCISPDVVLTRSNVGVFQCASELLDQGRIPHIIGRASEFSKLIDGVEALMNGQPAFHPELVGFRSWVEVEAHVQTPAGRALAALVHLVRIHDVAGLRRILRACVAEPGPGVTSVGTAYGVKGMEWASVRIGADFFDAIRWDGVSRADVRLLYVAVT